MPYIKDENNEEKYVPSIYAKEELPTWNEIYNEFYKEKIFHYDPTIESHQEKDLYWKLPHRKMLLGWICNQFNKMIFEDGMKASLLEFINSTYSDEFNTTASDIRFMLINGSIGDDNGLDSLLEKSNIGTEAPPPIYTCEIPSTGERSIFASNHPSINIKELDKTIRLVMIVKDSLNPDQLIKALRPLGEDCFECEGKVLIGVKLDDEVFDPCPELLSNIIAELIKDIIVYFEGDFVGWKDKDGKPLLSNGSEIKPGCGYQSGIDAAL